MADRIMTAFDAWRETWVFKQPPKDADEDEHVSYNAKCWETFKAFEAGWKAQALEDRADD